MKKKIKIKVILSSIVLTGTVCVISFISYYKNNTLDYKEILAPYQNVFDEFNKTHGTSYGFMTEEQLSRHNMNHDEYLKQMVDEYSNMTLDEFKNFLEETYNKDISAENLPYYKETNVDEELIIVSGIPSSNKNTFNYLNTD